MFGNYGKFGCKRVGWFTLFLLSAQAPFVRMDSTFGLVDRLAQLRNLVLKPELNGKYVLVSAYLPEKGRFNVRLLSSPNTEVDIGTISVKEDCLELCSKIFSQANIRGQVKSRVTVSKHSPV